MFYVDVIRHDYIINYYDMEEIPTNEDPEC